MKVSYRSICVAVLVLLISPKIAASAVVVNNKTPIEALKAAKVEVTTDKGGRVVGVAFPQRIERTDELLQHIQTFDHLRQLRLRGTDVTDVGMAIVGRMTTLEKLSVSNAKATRSLVTNAGLAELKSLSNLRSLSLWYNENVTDNTLEHLVSLKSLELLELTGTRITDAGMEHLGVLTNLKTLILTDCRITDSGLKALRNCSNLQLLDLRDTRIDGSGLRHLAKISTLLWLELDDTGIGDDLETVTDLQQLTMLSLLRTRVTDKGLSSLKKMPHLKWIKLTLGGNITPEGVGQLRKDLPSTFVIAIPSFPLNAAR